MIPQEGIHEQIHEICDEITNETDPHGVDAALAIRALKSGRTTIARVHVRCYGEQTIGLVGLLIPSMRWSSSSEYQLRW